MSRRFTFALAAAVLVGSSTASAWEPTIVGLDDDTATTSESTPAVASSALDSTFEPIVVGHGDVTVESPGAISSAAPVLAASQPTAARVTPEMVSEAAEADRAQGAAVASAPERAARRVASASSER